MEYGFGKSLNAKTTLTELMNLYKTLLRDEVDYLLTVRPSHIRPRQRRSSLLRQAGRRVSDSFLYDQETVELAKRHSSTASKRRSSMIDPLLVLALEEADDE